MATTELMREIYDLPLFAKFYIVEETLKAIKREEMAQSFENQSSAHHLSIDRNESAMEERRRKLLENGKKYSFNSKELGFKFNREEANNYDE